MPQRTRAQESSAAIQRLYIAMRHLFLRGSYKPGGVSGRALREALFVLRPEIYGTIADPEKVELDGLLYVFQRLPQGIEECRYIKLISREGYETSHFAPVVPLKRRRECYRIDQEQFFIEMTRGRSDIYDVLTHLTFLYVESEKIYQNGHDSDGNPTRDWLMLEDLVRRENAGETLEHEAAATYLSTILGRTYQETIAEVEQFNKSARVNSLFHIAYWMGRIAREEALEDKDREITFSSALREIVGHHIFGEQWARNVKRFLQEKGFLERPLHIVSANTHSFMNTLFARAAIKKEGKKHSLDELARLLSQDSQEDLRRQVQDFALANGMYQIEDESGSSITVQIFDLSAIPPTILPEDLGWERDKLAAEKPVLLVMDYAFGEQAYETMDELLKPFESKGKSVSIEVRSISIMGKAGILEGRKGDIMVPNAHIFEGTADNYPFENQLTTKDFEGSGIPVYFGPMITVLGTSLQNKDILQFFLESSWKAVGLEMEGAHYQKAIQAASRIRNNIRPDVKLSYAYYASDNPLITGHTLASGALGEEGVKPTYLITEKILKGLGKW